MKRKINNLDENSYETKKVNTINKSKTYLVQKAFNAHGLIEWGWNNLDFVSGKEFKSHKPDTFGNYSTIQFSVDGHGFKTDGVSSKDIFIFETEEEVNEDTKLRSLVELYSFDDKLETRLHDLSSISDAQKCRDNDTHTSLAFYCLDDDLNQKLIWTKEKGFI